MNFHFSKKSKIKLRLRSQSFKNTLHRGIQPFLLHGAPVWAETVEKARYSKMLTGVQRLINIKIAKAYRTVSNEALCIITGFKTLSHQNKRKAELYKIVKGNS